METRDKRSVVLTARRAVCALVMVIVGAGAGLPLMCVAQDRASAASQPPAARVVKAPTTAPDTVVAQRKAALRQLKALARKNPKDFPNYVTSLALLGLDGSVWVAAEDGLWRYQTDGSRKRYTTADGLGDESLYAVAVDTLGRVWVGHLNHGVSVFNGQKWQNYDRLTGPLGERIFAIKVCPSDGDVWIATNAGLARYSLQNNDWTYYTVWSTGFGLSPRPGLPSDQASAIAFDPEGNIYVGTQCDGIAMADAKDNYKTWRIVQGPDKMPTVSHGNGLPTNLINDLLVGRDGNVYAATTTGLAISEDKGRTWTFVRGKDWVAKVQGREGGAPRGFKDDGGGVLNEDYITCLAEDEAGMLHLGHWHEGYEVFDPFMHQVVARYEGDGFIRAILPLAGEKEPMIGTYGELSVLPPLSMVVDESRPAGAVATHVAAEPRPLAFPAVAKALTQQQLTELADSLKAIPAAATDSGGEGGPVVALLPNDWTTQGNWLGRYGRYWCTTTAQDYDHLWGVGEQPVGYMPRIGLQCYPGDSLRFWISSPLNTDDVRAMEMPPVYLHSQVLQSDADFASKYRRQAQHNDNGSNSYPMTNEGPSVYYSLGIPSGTYCLSFYASNDGGHTSVNRLRDYRFSVRPFAGQTDKLVPADPERVSRHERIDLVNLDGFAQRPEFAHARLRDFWGGAYTRFMVRGPAALTVEIARNYSFNTINSGVFLDDLLDEYPKAYYPVEPVTPPAGQSAAAAVVTEMHHLLQRNPAAWAQHHQAYIEVLRSIGLESPISNLGSTELAEVKSPIRSALASSAYHTTHFPLWEDAVHALGLKTTREIEKSLRWDGKTSIRSAKESQFLAQSRQQPSATGPTTGAIQENPQVKE